VFDAPGLPPRPLPAYTMRNGVVPVADTDPAARADALVRAVMPARPLGE
jgi:hypothetical protein